MAGATAIGVPSATGCYTHQCDPPPSPLVYSGGEMIDPNTYETNPIEEPDSGIGSGEPWIPYPPNATLTVQFPTDAGIGGRVPDGFFLYVGTSEQPNNSGGFGQVLGQLAEFYDAGPGGFTVLNDTCSNYFARFQVTFPAFPTEASAPVPPNASE
jgi:hypothetical protein